MFKVGDRVRYKKGNQWAMERLIGKEATIDGEPFGNDIRAIFNNGESGNWSIDNFELIEPMQEPVKLTKRMKIEMAKLKREIRASVVEFVDAVTRQVEAGEAPAKPLSKKALAIKEKVDTIKKDWANGKLLGDMFEILLDEKFMQSDSNRFVRNVMLVALNKNNGNNYFGGSPGLVRTTGSRTLLRKEGDTGNNFSEPSTDSRFATRDEIADFFEYFPDPLMMEVFNSIPAGPKEKK